MDNKIILTIGRQFGSGGTSPETMKNIIFFIIDIFFFIKPRCFY